MLQRLTELLQADNGNAAVYLNAGISRAFIVINFARIQASNKFIVMIDAVTDMLANTAWIFRRIIAPKLVIVQLL